MLCGIFGHKGKAKSRRDHGQGPIIAFTPIGRRAGHAFFLENVVSVAREFAIHPMNVTFAVQLSHWERALASKPMIAIDRDNHLLTKQRHNVGALVEFFAR